MVYEVHIATHRRSTQIQLLLHILIRKCKNNSNLGHKSNKSKLVDLRTILQEQADTYNDEFACTLTRFSGQRIKFEGKRIINI
jgi:hypothetical protein